MNSEETSHKPQRIPSPIQTEKFQSRYAIIYNNSSHMVQDTTYKYIECPIADYREIDFLQNCIGYIPKS